MIRGGRDALFLGRGLFSFRSYSREVSLSNQTKGEISLSEIKIALLGLGTVGTGVYSSLLKRKPEIEQLLGKKIRLSGILIKNPAKPRSDFQKAPLYSEFEKILGKEAPDVVIEAIGGIEPAKTYITRSLEAGCHVISANKDLIARHGEELTSLAKARGARFVYEASVGGGIPVLRTLRELLRINKVQHVEGILNGTSNFILSHMRTTGSTFPEALELAQQKGYAEPDPTNDIEGLDAFYKAMVLSKWIYGEQPLWEEAEVKGIGNVRLEEIQLAEQLGLRLKHLVLLDDSLELKVKPVLVDSEHPLYGVEGVDNAVRIQTDLLGCLTLQGPGAGAEATASAIVEDFLSLYETGSVYQDKPAVSEVVHKKQSKEGTTYLLFGEKEHISGDTISALQLQGAVLDTVSLPDSSLIAFLYAGDLPVSTLHFTSIYPVRLSAASEVAEEVLL
ncbi:homoserine dehydrogenase [Fictibacillus sp. S7]|nr:homoserine dehydrogenase [Fictibacillus sp. S7]